MLGWSQVAALQPSPRAEPECWEFERWLFSSFCCFLLFGFVSPHREVSWLTMHPSPRRCLTETPETLWAGGSSCWSLHCAQSGLTLASPHCCSTNRSCCSGNGLWRKDGKLNSPAHLPSTYPAVRSHLPPSSCTTTMAAPQLP